MALLPPTRGLPSQRLPHGIIPLALQQLDGVNREHGGIATNAIAMLAVDLAALAALVLWADAHHYPSHWLVPAVGVLLSGALAVCTLFPLARWEDGKRQFLRTVPVLKHFAVGLRPDVGPDVLPLLALVEDEADPAAYATILAAILRSTGRSSASLEVRTALITLAVVLLPLDALTSWIYFWVS